MKDVRHWRWVGVGLVALTMGCGAASDTALDEITEALGSAATAADYDPIVTKAKSAFDADLTNMELALVLSSAYAGRAGIDYLNLVEALSDVSKDTTAFKEIHGIFVKTITSAGLEDLRLAITTLSGFSGTVPTGTKRFYDQLGTFQTVEVFSLGTLRAKPTTDSTTTIANITAADRASTQSDFIEADNNLILGGSKSDNAVVQTLRKNYCALSQRSGGEGFTREELQDIVSCQLSSTPASLTTFQSASITSCASFDFTQCATTDSSL